MNRVDKSKLAAHPSTDLETLTELSKDPSNKVRAAVALNPLCSVDVQKNLALDSHLRVVQKLAKNQNLCPEAVDVLCQHPSTVVLGSLIANPVVDMKTKQHIISTNTAVAEGLAGQLANDDNFKKILATYPETKVRANFINKTKDVSFFEAGKYDVLEIVFSMAFNPVLPTDVLLYLWECYGDDKEDERAKDLMSFVMVHQNMPVQKVIDYYSKYPKELKTTVITKCYGTIDPNFYIQNWKHYDLVVKTAIVKQYLDNQNIVIEALFDNTAFYTAEDALLDMHLRSGEATFTRADKEERNKYIQDTIHHIVREYAQKFIPNQKDLPYEWVEQLVATLKPSTQNLELESQA